MQDETKNGISTSYYASLTMALVLPGGNFEEYGSLGKGYIHVHRIIPIFDFDEEHPIDPINDLCPVCPNCRAMLHRKSPHYAVDEIKQKSHGKSDE